MIYNHMHANVEGARFVEFKSFVTGARTVKYSRYRIPKADQADFYDLNKLIPVVKQANRNVLLENPNNEEKTNPGKRNTRSPDSINTGITKFQYTFRKQNRGQQSKDRVPQRCGKLP